MNSLHAFQTKPRRRVSGQGANDGEGWMVSYADLITLLFIFFALLLSISVVSQTKFQRLSSQMNQNAVTSLEEVKTQVDAQIHAEHLETQISTEMTDDGLQVQLSEGVLFSSGEATVTPSGIEVLKKLSALLKNIRLEFRLAIEGHTDSRPIRTAAFPSNWSLSSARAVTVLHFFSSQGIEDQKMMVRAYASTRPLAGKNDDQPQNRRVTVLVY